MAVHDNGGYSQWSTTPLTVGVWTHLVAVMDKSLSSGEVTGYVNGQLDGALYLDADNLNNFGNEPLYFATRGGTLEYFDGSLDDVRIYNRALSAQEVAELYNQKARGFKISNASIKNAKLE